MSDIALSLSHIKRNNMTTAAPTRAQSTTNAACPVPPGAVAVGLVYIRRLTIVTDYELPTIPSEFRIYSQLAPGIDGIDVLIGTYKKNAYEVHFKNGIEYSEALQQIDNLIQYYCLAEGEDQ